MVFYRSRGLTPRYLFLCFVGSTKIKPQGLVFTKPQIDLDDLRAHLTIEIDLLKVNPVRILKSGRTNVS